jgi:hypothetical protein
VCAGGGGGGGGPTTTTSTTTTIPWQNPTGTWTFVDMTCYVNILGTLYSFPQNAFVNVDAPSTVPQGEEFDIWVTPGTFETPWQVEGYAVLNVNSFAIRFPVMPDATFVDAVMTSGTNMGPGYPSFSIDNGQMIYRVPGPFAPGTSVQLPAIRLTSQATGSVGSTIETKMTNLINVAQFEVTQVGNTCIPNFSDLVFSTTTIT